MDDLEKVLTLGDWVMSFVVTGSNLSFTVAFANNAKVTCIEDISRTDDDFGERYTSDKVETDHDDKGDPDGIGTEVQYTFLGAYAISSFVDTDNHLNLWIEHEERPLPENTQVEESTPTIMREFTMPDNKSYTVTVPVYGYIEIDVEDVASQQEAQERAMEDCMNLRVDTSELKLAPNTHVELLPYAQIVEGNRSFIAFEKVTSVVIED
tara:strand:- start:7276 stop:7902 length:627 start_codon:yes stop_codon:yes gene_type:complete